ncbi:MAG: DUF2807 domain-containing protein [Paramuribaculum sp.]|nr:DUF2807 domain-containing protein [Paramuribaculum sp.]
MRYKLLIALILMSLTVLADEPTRYELNMNDFIELKVTDGINVDYKCNPDSAGKVVFETVPNLASQIIFVPGGDKLEIQLATIESGSYKDLPVITVYSTFLTKVQNSGDSTLRVLNIAPGPKFKAKLIGNGTLSIRDIETIQLDASINTGNGTIVISGKTQSASLKTTGAGTIQADGLKAQTLKCSLWGTGSIGCDVSESLSIFGAGSGTVYYRGNPIIKNRTIGVKTSHIE